MDFKLGEFEGTWKVTVGSTVGNELQVTKVGSHYKIDGPAIVDDNLNFDDVACTLKSDRMCLSLWKDCGRLFGIEEISGSFNVWAAEKMSGGSQDVHTLSETLPDWRLGEPWRVSAAAGNSTFGIGKNVKIESALLQPYTQLCEGNECYDTLRFNPLNRTMESMARTVAIWIREGLPNLIIAMFKLSGAGRQSLGQIENIEDFLRNLGLLDFETKILTSLGEVREGVWGAEEG